MSFFGPKKLDQSCSSRAGAQTSDNPASPLPFETAWLAAGYFCQVVFGDAITNMCLIGYTCTEMKKSTRSYSDRQRALKWVLLVTVPRTVLDDAPRLRTASVRQDQRQYCVLLESLLANGLRPSFAQASCKECASLSRSER